MRSSGALKLLVAAVLLGGALSAAPAAAQRYGAEAASPLQLEVRKLRERSDSLRAELKRQQRGAGEARHRIDALETQVREQAAELQRLRLNGDRLRVWTWALAALAALALLAALLLRPAGAELPPPLAAARERTGRLHEGLEALEARIRATEHGTERDPAR